MNEYEVTLKVRADNINKVIEYLEDVDDLEFTALYDVEDVKWVVESCRKAD